MSDWGSEDEGTPDLSSLALDLPDVEIKSAIPKPEAPATAPPPTVNAWAKRPESNDVRNLQRGNRRELHDEPRSAPPPARGGPGGGGGGFGGRSDSARGVKLYVTGLPQETSENQLQDHFADCGRVDVRLLYHNDSGNIKAAIITMEASVEAERGLAKDRSRFFGRSLFVKIDGAGRRDRDRGGYNNPDGGYNSRDGGYRAGGGGLGNGRSRDERRSGYGFNSDGSRDRDRDRDRDRSMPHDPTIPSGEVPTGRKKLNLKPRSKPMPKLDIDHRAIGGGPGAASAQAGQKKTWERKGSSSASFDGADKRVLGGDRSNRNGSGPDRNRRNAPAAGADTASVPDKPASTPDVPAPPAENGKKHGNKKASADDEEWSSVKGSGSATPTQKPEHKKLTSTPGRPGAGDNKQAAVPTLKNAFDVLGEADE